MIELPNKPLQQSNATRARSGRLMPRRRGPRPRLLAAVVRSKATLAFAAERQVVRQTGMTERFDRGVSIAAVLVAALMNTFLGFSQCGGYLSVERAVTGVMTALVVAAIGYRIVRMSSGTWGRRFLAQVPFGVGAVVVLALGFKVGEVLYMPPHSLREWLTFGC